MSIVDLIPGANSFAMAPIQLSVGLDLVGSRKEVTLADVSALALGCAVLGAGGGGNVETGSWAARHALREAGRVDLVNLADLPDDGLVLPLHAIGAPTVSQEMLPSGDEPRLIRDEVEAALGARVVALMPGEIGGANGVRCVGWARSLGLPVLDADGMGRAFPRIDMVSMELAGRSPNVLVIADVQGNVSSLRPVDGPWAERLARAICVAAGSTALMTSYVMQVSEAHGAVIEGTVSQAIRIGELLADRANGIEALCAELNARSLISGKITDLERTDTGGFVRASAVIAGTGADKGRLLRLEIQNENLVALEEGRPVATTPDPIVVLDGESAHALGTDTLQFGQRVNVIAWPCHPVWRTPKGLHRTGPRAFGYDLDFTPVEDLGVASTAAAIPAPRNSPRSEASAQGRGNTNTKGVPG